MGGPHSGASKGSDTAISRVAVIGGGITGITTAYLLASEGKTVAVLESCNIGEGTTGQSTGNLYSLVDERLYHIRKHFDEETMRKVCASRQAAARTGCRQNPAPPAGFCFFLVACADIHDLLQRQRRAAALT